MCEFGKNKTPLTKDDYIKLVKLLLDNMTKNKAYELVSIGSEHSFVNDNDIFDAIHSYIGILETPISEEERNHIIANIAKLISIYEQEKG